MKLKALTISISFLISITASTSVNVSETCGDTIPRHWFGPGCKYRCQCEYYDHCDARLGTCGNGNCKPGYSGTACQYVNAAFNNTIEPRNFPAYSYEAGLRKMVDGQPDSYFLEDGASGNPLYVLPIAVSWVDVITLLLSNETTDERIATGKDLQLKYYDEKNVSTELGNLEMDHSGLLLTYRLMPPALVSRVQVQAPKKTLSIAEISIHTGRNVAAKKTSSGPGPRADLAVDGNSSTCYNITQDAAGSAAWTVALGLEVLVWRLRITTSREVKVTTNVRINVTLHNGTVKEVQTTPVGGQFLQLAKPETADNLTIWNISSLASLCEVEVFGDCQDGKYGWECKENCTCAGSCDKVLGACSTDGCKAGFTGTDCKTKCPEGTYGDQCKKTCSKNCRNNSTCNFVTGVCLMGCKENWTGNNCTECAKGWYGVDCSQSCSGSCEDKDCYEEADKCPIACRPSSKCPVKAKAGSVTLRAVSMYMLFASLVALCH